MTLLFRNEILHISEQIINESLKISEEYANEQIEAQKKKKEIFIVLKRVSSTYFKILMGEQAKKEQKIRKRQLDTPNESTKEKILSKNNIFNLKKTMAETSFRHKEMEQNSCVICQDKLPDCVYMPCGHGGICYQCGTDIKAQMGQCSLCRQNITNVLRIDLSQNVGSLINVIDNNQ